MGPLVAARKQMRGLIFPTNPLLSLFEGKTFERVLDVGAGTGFFMELLVDNGIAKQVVGAETNAAYFGKVGNVGEIVDVKSLSGKYELILFNDVLHHVSTKKEFLKNYVENHLEPGGYVLIKDMRPEVSVYKYWNRFHDLVFAGEKISEISESEVMDILGDSFEVVNQGRKQIFLYDHYFMLLKHRGNH